MANIVKVTNTVPEHMDKLTKQKTRDLLYLLAASLDRTRERAFQKYMIPNTQGRERRIRVLVKRQPVNSTKLTSRTRALEKMLTEKAPWRVGFKRATSRTDALVSNVKTLEQSSNNVEVQATTSSKITNVSTYTKSKRESRQKLAARFLWDSPSGIRGQRRPNISLAIQDEKPVLERAIRNQASHWK